MPSPNSDPPRKSPLLILALLVLPAVISLVATSPAASATGQVTGLAGTATYFHTTLGWTAVSDADAYKVFVSKTGTTYPTNYSQVSTVQQTYTDASDAVNVAAGTYTNGNTLTSPTVQSIAADATKPLITLVRFSISPNGGANCGTMSAKIATADYTLAGGTWNAAKEVAGVSFTTVNGGATDTPTDVTIDFTAGTVSFNGGTSWSPNVITYTGIGGAASAFSGPARVGANGAYLQISGSSTNCLVKTDTADPYAGGNAFTSSGGTYTSVAGTDLYHLRVQRSPGASPAAPAKLLGGLVFSSTYRFRVLASSLATGDGTISDDLSMTMPDNSVATEEVYALTLGASGGNSCATSNALSVTAGHAYIVTIGANVGNQDQLVTGSVTGQYFDAKNTGILTGVNPASGATLLNWQVNGNANAWTVYFIAQNTETITYQCTLNGSQTAWTPTTDCNRLPGCIGNFYIGGFTGALFDAQLAKISEVGVISGCTSCAEATKTPTTTQFAWTQIANDQQLTNIATADNSIATSGLQSFFANQTTQGRFLDTTAFRLQQSASGCNGDTLQLSISADNAYPWNTALELANLTSTITSISTATTVGVTIDWSNGIISNSAPFTFSTPTAKAGGTAVTIGSANFLNNFPPTMAAGGTFYLHWNIVDGGGGGTCGVMYSSSDKYLSGSVYTDGGTQWTQQPTGDLSGWVMNVYGGIPIIYTLSATLADPGGAYYAYICEAQKDATPQQYNFTSSFGGRAKPTGYQAAGNAICSGVIGMIGGTSLQQTIQEWRIGYDTIPRNASASLTITIDTGGSSRNLVYVGLFAGSQPTHQHLIGPANFTASGYNAFTPYRILTTDDFFTQLDFTVKECANTDCSTFGNTSATAAYVITICPGALQRQVSGTVNSTGHAVVTGQDIPGCLVTITLTGSGATGAAYSSTTWTNTIGSAGSYSFTVGVFFASTTGGAFQLGALSITFSGNFTRVVPDLINITINRTRADDLFVDCVRLDPNAGAVRSACTVDEWAATESSSYYRANQYQGFTYPQSIRINTNSGDVGTYVVFVVNATGYWLGSQAFCVYSSWTSTGCNANIGADLQGQLAADTLNEATAAQRDLANAQAAISETTVRQHYLDMLDFALAPFADCSGTVIAGAANEPGCTVPNIAWWYLGTLIVAAVGVSRGGGRR